MKKCISSFTVSVNNPPPLEEFLRSAAAHNLEAIDYPIEATEALITNRGVASIRELVAGQGVQLAGFLLPVRFHLDTRTFQDDVSKLPQHASQAQQVGYKLCTTWVPPTTAEDPLAYACRLIPRVRECCKILNDHDLPLAIEWIGPAHLREHNYDFVHTMARARLLVEAIDSLGCGLLVDSFHLFTAGDDTTDLEDLPSDLIVHVHLNDAPDVPRHQQLDNNRLFPGQGIIDLTTMLDVLAKKSYQGYLSVEVLSEVVSSWPLDKIMAESKIGLDRVLSS